MGRLLDRYEEVLEKVAEEQLEQEPQLTEEQAEIIYKYASVADELLADEFGNDYEAEDVEKLATLMLQHDLAVEEQEEQDMAKIAEAEELGIIQARAFANELVRLSQED